MLEEARKQLSEWTRGLWKQSADKTLELGDHFVIDVPDTELKLVVIVKNNREVCISATGYDGEKRGIFYPREKGQGRSGYVR